MLSAADSTPCLTRKKAGRRTAAFVKSGTLHVSQFTAQNPSEGTWEHNVGTARITSSFSENHICGESFGNIFSEVPEIHKSLSICRLSLPRAKQLAPLWFWRADCHAVITLPSLLMKNDVYAQGLRNFQTSVWHFRENHESIQAFLIEAFPEPLGSKRTRSKSRLRA